MLIFFLVEVVVIGHKLLCSLPCLVPSRTHILFSFLFSVFIFIFVSESKNNKTLVPYFSFDSYILIKTFFFIDKLTIFFHNLRFFKFFFLIYKNVTKLILPKKKKNCQKIVFILTFFCY